MFLSTGLTTALLVMEAHMRFALVAGALMVGLLIFPNVSYGRGCIYMSENFCKELGPDYICYGERAGGPGQCRSRGQLTAQELAKYKSDLAKYEEEKRKQGKKVQ